MGSVIFKTMWKQAEKTHFVVARPPLAEILAHGLQAVRAKYL